MRTALLALAALGLATSANAATFNFNSPTGNLGNTEVYTVGTLSVTASGFDGVGGTVDLFGKSDGLGEEGLGLTSDPTGQGEISGSNFVQIDVLNLFGHVIPASVLFSMNSVTGEEGWAVFGSNVAGSLGVSLVTGADENVDHSLPSFGTYRYYDFVATGGHAHNVLLHQIQATATVPEPATWAMMILGFGTAGAMLRRRRTLTA